MHEGKRMKRELLGVLALPSFRFFFIKSLVSELFREWIGSLNCHGFFCFFFLILFSNFIIDAVVNKGGDESIGKGDGKNH